VIATAKISLLAVAIGTLATAASPVASVTSSRPFDLHGNRVNVDGVPFWPVMSGDEVSTLLGQAVIGLRDGSRVVLLGNSRAKVEPDDQGFSIRLLSGSMRVLSAATDQRFYVQNSVVNPTVGQVVSVSSPAPPKRVVSDFAGNGSVFSLVPRPVSRR
jgi:hypothetical protein